MDLSVLDCIQDGLIGTRAKDYLKGALTAMHAAKNQEAFTTARQRVPALVDKLRIDAVLDIPDLSALNDPSYGPQHLVTLAAQLLAPAINESGPTTKEQAQSISEWMSAIEESLDSFMNLVCGYSVALPPGRKRVTDAFERLVSAVSDTAGFGFDIGPTKPWEDGVPAFPNGARFIGALNGTDIGTLRTYTAEWAAFLEDPWTLKDFAAEAASYRDVLTDAQYANAYHRKAVCEAYGVVFRL